MIKQIIILLISILCVFGCKNSVKEYTYFGGKIVHPMDSVVYVSGIDGFKDTLKLCSDKTFMGQYRTFRSGLYRFSHGFEHQYAYIEENDSLMLRLNTWDFDESIVYTGKHAMRNNLMMEAFLQGEEEKKFLKRHDNSGEKVFFQKADSLLALKKIIIEAYKKNAKKISKEFLDYYKIILTYPIFIELEGYLDRKIAKNILNISSIKDQVFQYRKKINLGRDSLVFYLPYKEYLCYKIYNDTGLKIKEQQSEEFVIEFLKNIDNEISNERIKNNFLYKVVSLNFLNRAKGDNYQKAFFTYFNFSTDIEQKKEIQRLINDFNFIEKNDNLPDFKVEAPTGSWVDISELTKDKKSVVFFNNPKYSYYDQVISKRFNYLQKKYPKINFILIQQNKSNSEGYVKGINIENQFKLIDESRAHSFLTSDFPRLMILNEGGVVMNAFTGFFAPNIEDQIEGLLKK